MVLMSGLREFLGAVWGRSGQEMDPAFGACFGRAGCGLAALKTVMGSPSEPSLETKHLGPDQQVLQGSVKLLLPGERCSAEFGDGLFGVGRQLGKRDSDQTLV